jgi:hypothetical protein
MNDLDLKIAFAVFKKLEPKLNENIQLYDSGYDNRFGNVVRFVSNNKTIAVWLDFPALNEYKLKMLFKNHNKLQYNFFIQQIGNFYRVGWKL